MICYDKADIDVVVAIAAENPRGFLHLVEKYCTSVTPHQVERSMRAWGINVPPDSNAQSPNNRTARSRKDHRYPKLR